MLSLTDFNEWFADYRSKWPAVADYLRRQENAAALRDGWHQTLVAFDRLTLDRVTVAILQGQMEPVENVKLGTFANEIRQRCRLLLDQERRARERQKVVATARSQRKQFSPLRQGNMVHMVACGIAADQLTAEATGEPVDTACVRYSRPHSVTPDIPHDAAVVLADDHTDCEETEAHATLAAVGLTWEQVEARAAEIVGRGITLCKEA